MSRSSFPGRLGVLQQWLPSYRLDFFDMLAARCDGGLCICAGESPAGDLPDVAKLKCAKLHVVRNYRPLTGAFELILQHGVLGWLRAFDPEVLVATPNPRMPSVVLARRWMRSRGRKTLGWGLGTMAVTSGIPMAVRQVVRRPLISGFDGMIAYSSRAAREYEALGFPRDHIRVARNATAHRPVSEPQPRPIRSGGGVTVVSLGQLTPPKRIDLLISACATLAREGAAPIDLIIIGDGPARAALEQHAKTEFPSTRFIGHCAGDSLRSFLVSADLFVMPGMGGLAIQEAMASALPVIVAEGDGTQMDLVRPGNGWNVATDSLSGLVVAMRDAVSDIPRLRQMGAESFRIVNEEINLESMVDAYIDAVCALASRNGEITHQ